MPTQPFLPLAGRTVVITAASAAAVSTTLTTVGFSNAVLVNNTATVTLFIRLDSTSSTLASGTDIAMQAGTSRIFANPLPTGGATVSVSASVNGSGTGGLVYFTPGQGGI